ncbi:hypothetical protein [Pectobacterium actinidiae]|uniref:hypothetical protein n=1 Tax=Pectobacterium actinidiae TaxID=1507808 RepID=UPI001F49182D|nr:hypothetical protein [Pectobacterium actinidiae]
MAYEGVFIELMSIGFNPDDIDVSHYIGIGIGLNKESVFDFDFWNKLNAYLNIS